MSAAAAAAGRESLEVSDGGGGVVFLQRGSRGGNGDGGGDEWRRSCPSLLRQETKRPAPGGRRQRGLPVPGGREPQASHYLEEERCATHHGIQVHTWKQQAPPLVGCRQEPS